MPKKTTSPKKLNTTTPKSTSDSKKVEATKSKVTPSTKKKVATTSRVASAIKQETAKSKAASVAKKATTAESKVAPVAKKASTAKPKVATVEKKASTAKPKVATVAKKATAAKSKAVPVAKKETTAKPKVANASKKEAATNSKVKSATKKTKTNSQAQVDSIKEPKTSKSKAKSSFENDVENISLDKLTDDMYTKQQDPSSLNYIPECGVYLESIGLPSIHYKAYGHKRANKCVNVATFMPKEGTLPKDKKFTDKVVGVVKDGQDFGEIIFKDFFLEAYPTLEKYIVIRECPRLFVAYPKKKGIEQIKYEKTLSQKGRPRSKIETLIKPKGDIKVNGLRYLVLSDLHGGALEVEQALKFFDKYQCDFIVLLGDLLNHGPRNYVPKSYDPPKVAQLLNAHKEHIISIRGNCDSEVDSMMFSFLCNAPYGFLQIVCPNAQENDNGKHHAKVQRIFLTHGHLHPIDADDEKESIALREKLGLKENDIVLSGHTHISGIFVKKNGLVNINPGSTTIPKGNTPAGFAVIFEDRIELKQLDGKTIDTYYFKFA